MVNLPNSSPKLQTTKNYETNTGLYKKQGFVVFQTTYGSALGFDQIRKIYGYHQVEGLQYILNGKSGFWEAWGSPVAIAMLRRKTQRPEESQILHVKASVASVLEPKTKSSTLDSPGIVIG